MEEVALAPGWGRARARAWPGPRPSWLVAAPALAGGRAASEPRLRGAGGCARAGRGRRVVPALAGELRPRMAGGRARAAPRRAGSRPPRPRLAAPSPRRGRAGAAPCRSWGRARAWPSCAWPRPRRGRGAAPAPRLAPFHPSSGRQ